MSFNTQSLSKMRDLYEGARNRMAKMKEQSEAIIGEGLKVVEVSGSAFALGYANERYGKGGELMVAGVPVDLGVGVGLLGVTLFGGLGKYAEHGANVAAGALAAFGYRSGAEMGRAALAKAGTTTGALPVGSRLDAERPDFARREYANAR